MEPPIAQSITLIGPDCWAMGSMMLVEKITGSPPAEALKVWNDGESTYCIRPNPEPITTRLPPPGETGDKVYEAGTQAVCYAIGEGTVCKVKPWKEGRTSEAETLKFVQKNAPSVPVPESYYYWVDEAWQRCFLLMRRAPGQSLDDAWGKLTDLQRRKIAEEVATHIETLAKFTSTRLESADGKGVRESRLVFEYEGHDKSLPSWVPTIHPRYTAEQLTTRLSEYGTVAPPFIEAFHFYHQDMGPTNVLIVDPIPEENSELPLISAIIDWEDAGYYPHWWICTAPLVSGAYRLNWKLYQKTDAWQQALADSLEARGLYSNLQWYWPYYDAWAEKGRSK